MRVTIPVTAGLLLCCAFRAHADERHDHALVCGAGFALGIRVPDGWKTDTDNATELQANVILYRRGETAAHAQPVIRLRVLPKVDENTSEDLKADTDSYRKEFPQSTFEDVAVDHPQYRTFSRLFLIEGRSYEYVAYANPGPGTHALLSVTMTKEKARATKEELEAFRRIIRSLDLLVGAQLPECAR